MYVLLAEAVVYVTRIGMSSLLVETATLKEYIVNAESVREPAQHMVVKTFVL